APYNGVVAQRFADEGQTIVASKPVIAFQNIDDIEVVADVPEATIAANIRSAAGSRIVAGFSAAPGRPFPVRITEVPQVAVPPTQTFQVRAAMKTPRGVTVLPGMTAVLTATYRGAKARGRFRVPIAAVCEEDSGAQVAWVIGPDQTVHSRPVKMGEAADGQIEIVDGLRAG